MWFDAESLKNKGMNVVAYLTQFSNSVPVIKFPIDQSLMTIGQNIDMDICVPEEGIAEKHAEIEVIQHGQAYQFVVKSTETNATIQHNGNTVSQAELQDGDWLLIGEIEFQFSNDGVNEIKDENILSFNIASTETVKLSHPASALPEEPRVMKTAQLLSENRFSRRLNRF